MNHPRSRIRGALALLLALGSLACAAERQATPPPRPPSDAPANDTAIRDLSQKGYQGVSGELIPAHASTRFLVGFQYLDNDFWGPVDDRPYIGIESAYEREGDLFGGEFGLSYSAPHESEHVVDPVAGSGTLDVDLSFSEIYAGLHRSFLRDTRIKPYVGAGVSAIYYKAEKEFTSFSLKDDTHNIEWTFGLYVHGGIAVQLSENVQIGLDLRALGGTEVNDLYGDGDLNYQRLSLFIGFGD